MTRLCLVLLAGIWAQSALAEVVAIRSGDHAGFSRLVLTIAPGAAWRLGRDQSGYALEVPGATGFDLSGVMERLPSGRIGQLVPQGDRLSIAAACVCHAVAFLWRDNRLVVDLADGPAPPESPFETPLDEFAPNPAITSAAEGPLLPLILPTPPPPLLGLAVPLLPVPVPVQPDEVTSLDADLAALRAIAGPGIATRTALDGSLPPQPGAARPQCWPPGAFDISGWTETADAAAEIGRRRTALFDALDRPDPAAIEDLARAYVRFGFGQEALAVLAMDPQGSTSRDLLSAQAVIVDGGLPSAATLAESPGCTGPVHLWVALARGSLLPASPEERRAAAVAWRLLPEPLLGQLANRVAQLFLEVGDTATAADIVAIAAGAGGPDLTVTAAEIAQAQGQTAQAIDQLDQAARQDPRLPTDALLRLVTLSLAEGRIVSPAQRDLLAARRFETDAPDLHLALLEAEALALAQVDGPTAALGLLAESSIAVPQTVTDRIVTDAARDLDDAGFATFALAPLPALGPAAANLVAARLIALGFPDAALRHIGPDTAGDPQQERRYLRAAALTAQGDGAAALAALDGLTDPRAATLRSQALARAGDHAGALAANRAALGMPYDPDLAWRATDWALVALAADPLLAEAATAAQSAAALDGTEPDLAARLSLIAEATATRDLAAALLARFSEAP